MGWKIVRDNDSTVAPAMGVSGVWREAAPERVIPGLTRKLFEEASDFAEAGDAEELYDLLDVIRELLLVIDQDSDAYYRHMLKVEKRGGFSKHIEWSPVPGDS